MNSQVLQLCIWLRSIFIFIKPQLVVCIADTYILHPMIFWWMINKTLYFVCLWIFYNLIGLRVLYELFKVLHVRAMKNTLYICIVNSLSSQIYYKKEIWDKDYLHRFINLYLPLLVLMTFILASGLSYSWF